MSRNKKSLIRLADRDSCSGCAACAAVCPSECITMVEDGEGFLHPKIDASKCVQCHKCEAACPVTGTRPEPMSSGTKAYAIINNNGEIRLKSSSGGVFYALADYVISNGGVVFGARFDEDFRGVHHDYTESRDGIAPFMRSKYVQSRTGESFRKCREFLNQGRQVLYSGTPCQIAGLLKMLGRKYENLLTVDLICHGVPSPKVWRSYLNWVAKGRKVTDVNFRNKEDGWNNYHISINFSDGSSLFEGKTDNRYFRGFLGNVFLRRSCYHCAYRTCDRVSDLTIADYWGAGSLCPEMFDNRGTSIVLVHSAEGHNILNKLSNALTVKEQSIENAVQFNPGANGENPFSNRRKRYFFFNRFGCQRLSDYAAAHDAPLVRVRRKIKKVWRKAL